MITYEIGCYLDHGSRTVDELNTDIVELAIGAGMPEPTIDHEGPLWSNATDVDEQVLEELADEAIDWLNDNTIDDRPPFTYWGDDGYAGAFGLRVNVDEARMADNVIVVDHRGYVTSCDFGPDYILEINDHGNATLYRITREEVWGVV